MPPSLLVPPRRKRPSSLPAPVTGEPTLTFPAACERLVDTGFVQGLPDALPLVRRKMLAMGADSAVQITDDALAGSDAVQTARVLAAAGDLGVPRIHFGVGTGELLVDMGAAGADVVGVDWRIPLDEADRRLGHRYAVQGNLDPLALIGGGEPLAAAATRSAS